MAAREVIIESTTSTVEEPGSYNGREDGGLPYVNLNGEKPVPACTKVL